MPPLQSSSPLVSSPLLETARLICDFSQGTSLNTLIHALADDAAIQEINDFFGLPEPLEGILISWFLVKGSSSEGKNLTEMLAHFNKDVEYAQACLGALQVLSQKGLLNANINLSGDPSDLSATFILPLIVFHAAMHNDPRLLKHQSADDYKTFLPRIFQICSLRKDGKLSHSTMEHAIQQEEIAHIHLPEMADWNNIDLPLEERIVIYNLLRNQMMQDYIWLDMNDILKEIYDDPAAQFRVLSKMRRAELRIQQEELIEAYSDDLSSQSIFRLAHRAYELLCPGTQPPVIKSTLCTLTYPHKIGPEKLYFNGEEATQLSFLQDALQPETLQQLQHTLVAANLSPAITILLHGHPGTGKTASVMQWGRATGRVVMRVEIDKIRQKWLGESERNLQNVFREYDRCVREQPNLPILLFNEADALFSHRIAVERSVDQVHNNLQNILLQSLEDFKGILIATTNMPKMLDEAFDRRFLYKIAFTRPQRDVRLQILRDAFPAMDPGWLEELDERYELTGAQIRNLSRRLLMQRILKGSVAGRADLLQAAADETSLKRSSTVNTIGFQVYKQCS